MTDDVSIKRARENPDEAETLLRQAEQGDVDAQYAVGLVYAEGRGVERNLALAWFWLSIAARQGNQDADNLLAMVDAQMSDEERTMAREIFDKFQSGVLRFGVVNPKHLH
jgi:TPR repeat protein